VKFRAEQDLRGCTGCALATHPAADTPTRRTRCTHYGRPYRFIPCGPRGFRHLTWGVSRIDAAGGIAHVVTTCELMFALCQL
jgi:hypothetical protein